jgi:WD40 repeat protein
LERVNRIVFSPDGKTLVTAGNDHTLKFWDASTGKNLNSFDVGTRVINIAYIPGGRFLAAQLGASTTDSEMLLMEQSSNPSRPLKSFLKLKDYGDFVCLDFNPDKKQMATGLSDGKILIWDLPGQGKPKVPQILPGHHDCVFSLAYSPDGQYLASGGMDRKVILRDLKSQEGPRTITGFDHWVVSLAFSPDGKLLAAGSFDRTVKVFDSATGKLLHSFSHPAAVSDVAFSPDGQKLATACCDNRWYIHPLDLQEAVTQAEKKVTRKLTPEECQKYKVECPRFQGPEAAK